jgi:hypothetical protein
MLRSLVWIDRQGRETPLKIEPRTFWVPRWSHDGMRLVAHVAEPPNSHVVVTINADRD